MPRSRRTVVCTCEDVALSDVDAALAKGYRDVESVKRYTGFGTGVCQGRSCLVAIARYLESKGLDAAEVVPITPRPPVFPVALGRLAKAAPGDDDPEAAR